MPSPDQLPPSLIDFVYRHAVRVDTGQDFDYHMERLIRSMDGMLSQPSKSAPSGETKIPAKSSTGSRHAAEAAVAEAPRKVTGARTGPNLAAAAERSAERPQPAMPRISPALFWPPDRQGQMLRLGIAGAAAVVVLLVTFGIFFRGSGGDETRLRILTGHNGAVSAVAFSPNATMVAGGSYDKSVMIWDASTGVLRQTLSGESEAVYAVAFEPNGKRVVSAGKDGIIAIRDIDTGQRIVRALRPEMTYGWDVLPAVLSLAVSPDGTHIVSGNADSTVKIWVENTGTLFRILPGHTDAVTSVAYSPDGRTILSGSADGMVRTWDATSGQSLRALKTRSAQVLAVAISPDGKRFAAAGSGDSVVVWNAVNLQQLQLLSTQLSGVNALAFARDSRHLAVGGSDTSIQVWDTDSGQSVHSLTGHSGAIRSLAYSSDGRRLASGSDDTTVGIWPGN